MEKLIDSDEAKLQLGKINDMLTCQHVLIGGLAVQQFHKARDSKDIDLICDNKTAKNLIDNLYPTKDYIISDKNDDEYRPAYVICHKIRKNQIIFFGPKILERDSYPFIDMSALMKDSNPFIYKGKEFQNVRIPSIEKLAYIKLLSFLNRITSNREKGEMDLRDFINLSNQDFFRMNLLIDQIRAFNCEKYIHEKLSEISNYDKGIWSTSLFMEFSSIVRPVIANFQIKDVGSAIKDEYHKIYEVQDSVDFYNKTAEKYDERNTNYILQTHKKIITLITKLIRNKKEYKILDLGAGTGRLLAFHFFDKNNIEWIGVDPSSEMLNKFESNIRNSTLKYRAYKNSIFDLPQVVLDEKYDIIIISCVLTSLPHHPKFLNIVNLLKPKGTIIIADIHPCLTQKKPFYDFEIENNKIALAPRTVYPLDIIKELLPLNIEIVSVDLVENTEKEKYSFVLQFKKRI